MAVSSIPPDHLSKDLGVLSLDAHSSFALTHTSRDSEFFLAGAPDKSMFEVQLQKATQKICKGNNLSLVKLSGIQRKFLTHYRCSNCGLLPLYHVDLPHVRRVRCNKCHDLIHFKAKGKYGKLRKAIAFELKFATGDAARAV